LGRQGPGATSHESALTRSTPGVKTRRGDPVAPTKKSAYASSVNASDFIIIDPGILGGTPVLRGTRVPVQTLLQ